MSEQAGNQKLVAMLRRMADRIEKSPTLQCWKASASGGEPVSIDMRPLSEQPIAMYAPMNFAIFIGDPLFVSMSHHVLAKEGEAVLHLPPKKSKGKQ